MILIFPDDSWDEIISESELKVENPYWRQWELYLKHLIYRDENIPDDFVVEPDLYVKSVFYNTGWGVEIKHILPEYKKGAWRYDPPIKNPNDIKKLAFPIINRNR